MAASKAAIRSMGMIIHDGTAVVSVSAPENVIAKSPSSGLEYSEWIWMAIISVVASWLVV